jgi:hypothetical protein
MGREGGLAAYMGYISADCSKLNTHQQHHENEIKIFLKITLA